MKFHRIRLTWGGLCPPPFGTFNRGGALVEWSRRDCALAVGMDGLFCRYWVASVSPSPMLRFRYSAIPR